jgi:hypothetical protein
MSLGWLRRSSRLIAVFLLLTSMWQLPHRSQDDELCAPAGAENHDASKHVFTDAAAAGHQDHCAICHWIRWMKPQMASRPIVARTQGAGSDLAPATAAVLRDPSTDRLPARAPPAL